MQIICQTWLILVKLTCGSWSEVQHHLYFTVQWFRLVSWRLFDVWTWQFGIMVQYDWMFDLKIKVDHWPVFHGSVIFCLISWRWQFGIMVQYDQMFDLKIKVGHCDLYFMVQWFCPISWRLCNGENNISGLFTFEWFALIAEKTTFDLGTLDSGERSLPFGLPVIQLADNQARHKILDKLKFWPYLTSHWSNWPYSTKNLPVNLQ